MKKKAFLALVALLILLPSSLLTAQAKYKYTFYHRLWSVTEPNVQWHVKGGEAYMKTNPEVRIKYADFIFEFPDGLYYTPGSTSGRIALVEVPRAARGLHPEVREIARGEQRVLAAEGIYCFSPDSTTL
jgi:hypothetical protein